MMEQWTSALDNNNFSAAVLLDLSAAFDVVNIRLLLDKLKLYGFKDNVIRWLSSYLTDRQQLVYIDGCFSDPVPVNIGVPQGSILGPLMYILFTNDFPEVVHDHEPNDTNITPFNLPCHSCGGICCFADDSSFIISSQSPDDLKAKLESNYNAIANYMLGNKLALNSEKTQFMVIASRNQHRRNNDNLDFQLDTGSELVNASGRARILGLNVSNDLSWNEHILKNSKSLVKSLSFKINGLRKICTHADFKTRKLLANGMVGSNLVYMIQLYGQASDYLIKMLQVQQNKAARIVTRLEWGTSTHTLLKQIGWLSVQQLYVYHSLLLLWKIQTFKKPRFLEEQFTRHFPYQTRRATSSCLSVSAKPRTELCRRSFVYSSTLNWNKLPYDLRIETKLETFKAKLKIWVRNNIPQ